MNKIILGSLFLFFLVVNAQPALSVCEPYFTGGGNITEGQGKDSLKITFATNVFYDVGGLPAGVIHFNFVNTSSGFLNCMDSSTDRSRLKFHEALRLAIIQ